MASLRRDLQITPARSRFAQSLPSEPCGQKDAVSSLLFDFDSVLMTSCCSITFQPIKPRTLQQGLREEKVRSIKKVAVQFSLDFIVYFMKRTMEAMLSNNFCSILTLKAHTLKTKHTGAKDSFIHIHAEYMWSWKN